MNKNKESNPAYTGHRKKIKSTFLENYDKNYHISEQDLLELILFYAIPRKDVKPIAKSLLKEFGSISKLMAAPYSQMKNIPNVTENTFILLSLIKLTNKHLLKKQISKAPILSNWASMLDYLYMDLSHEGIEYIKILFLNHRNILIKDEIIQEGTINYASIYPREIVKKALDISATGFIMAHNHPSGELDPSKEDILITNKLVAIAKELDIILYDHIIISSKGVISLKQLGLL